MLPAFASDGNLPPGIHPASWAQAEAAFGFNRHREQLLVGLRRALEALRSAGCKTVWIDGSFVTKKDLPSDVDGCWDPVGVDLAKLDPVLKDFSNRRQAQKVKFGGEFFPSSSVASLHPTKKVFLEFFQQDKQTGSAKGIVQLDLGSLP